MNKSKFCCFVIAGLLGIVGLNPITTFAAETNKESVTLSETNNNQKDKKADFQEKIKKASGKWNNLTDNQKKEIYSLLENEMKDKNKIVEKLVEFGVMEKEDAAIYQSHMLDRFNKLKESGEFPLFRQKGNKKQ